MDTSTYPRYPYLRRLLLRLGNGFYLADVKFVSTDEFIVSFGTTARTHLRALIEQIEMEFVAANIATNLIGSFLNDNARMLGNSATGKKLEKAFEEIIHDIATFANNHVNSSYFCSVCSFSFVDDHFHNVAYKCHFVHGSLLRNT